MPANLALLVWNQTDLPWGAAITDALDNVIPPQNLSARPPHGLLIKLRGNGNADFTTVADVLFSVQSQHPEFRFVLLGTNPAFFVDG